MSERNYSSEKQWISFMEFYWFKILYLIRNVLLFCSQSDKVICIHMYVLSDVENSINCLNTVFPKQHWLILILVQYN